MHKAVIILGIIAVLVFTPLVVIWSLNTLFQTGIEYSARAWLAIILIQGWVQGMLSISVKRK